MSNQTPNGRPYAPDCPEPLTKRPCRSTRLDGYEPNNGQRILSDDDLDDLQNRLFNDIVEHMNALNRGIVSPEAACKIAVAFGLCLSDWCENPEIVPSKADLLHHFSDIALDELNDMSDDSEDDSDNDVENDPEDDNVLKAANAFMAVESEVLEFYSTYIESPPKVAD